jgi:hypothetical protein
LPIADAHFIGNVRDGATGPDPIDQESLAAHLSRVLRWDLYRETLARAVADHLAIETGQRGGVSVRTLLVVGGRQLSSGPA